LPWRDVNENAFQLAQSNKDCLNEVDRVNYDQMNKINKNELDKMKSNSEPFRKSNRIKKATSIKQNYFYGQCKPEEYK
jgi:hypothetical protein